MIKTLRVTNYKMSSVSNKKSLAQKLIQKGRILREASIPDIEDVAGPQCAPSKSQFFSPIQTRHQRKISANPPKNLILTEKQQTLHNDEVANMRDELKPLTVEKVNEATAAVITKRQKQKQTKKKGVQEAKQELGDDSNVNCKDINMKPETSSKWEPRNWMQMLQNIRQMRAASLAPVDFMGCDKCADDEADEKTQRFHKLVSLMLSSQTKDETTYEAMQRLKSHTLTPNSIVEMNSTDLENILKPVSFYKNKAKYLQQTSRILIDQYAQDIPNNVKDLIALPGVGPKMAHICMATAWNEITGIGVDVHVHRISNRMGWLPNETKEPERTRVALEEWLPRELWAEVNHLLVGFGQTICTPLQPKCGNCLNNNICPAAFKSSPTKSGKTKNMNTKNAEETAMKKVPLKKPKMHL